MRIGDLYFEVVGHGPPLLLLHGFTGSLRSFDLVRSALASANRLILVDLIGHGQSASPADVARYSMESCVSDVLAVLDALSFERANVLGYSMGGRVALCLATIAPERVQTLLLESASPGIEDPAARAARATADDALAARIERHGIAAFVSEWEAQPLLALAENVPIDVRQARHDQRLRNNPHGLANSLRGMGTGRQPSLWDRLPHLEVPTRLLVGERDNRFRDICRRMRERLPHAELTVCPGSGHTVHLDRPADFIDWSRQLTTSAIDC